MVQRGPLDAIEPREQAWRFEALAHPIRWSILHILLSNSEGTIHVQDLERLCGVRGYVVRQAAISRHLRVLSQAGLIELHSKRRLYRYYRVKREALLALQGLLSQLEQTEVQVQ